MRVGFRSGMIGDAARLDWDGAGPRPISWAAWYPVENEATAVLPASREADAAWFRRGAVVERAPPRASGEPWPAVLISHGTGGSALQMDWLGHRLARRGVVALAPNHHGNTLVEPFRPAGFLCWWERARDLSVLLDHVVEDEAFAPHVDAGRIFVAGFSLGGHTALSILGGLTDMACFQAWIGKAGSPQGPRAFPAVGDRIPELMAGSAVFRSSWERQSDPYLDRRIRAGLLLAPAPPVRAFTDASLGQITAPIHMMTGGADDDAPVEVGAVWLGEGLRSSSLDIVDARAGHLIFLPEATDTGRLDAPELCRDAPGVDRGAVHDAVAKAAAKLFGL
ncbi:alpha/beta hydrolase family protein [Lichenifustis flavocetrariae]|uniref:Alpha/beta hydrolase n=1 Tax=Lichenifustis flavocetrariae TaxID=2949735 RepID=A0AA41Z0R1_9HYPH|nr:alpha/beta hydrolase [Lichenifustis flavocetrariae]MCW6512074.1 alpha/beta hydrolase [Lichenifustis flavocetrariae]